MRQILVIGIGAGNPDHITMQAIKALNRADVHFIPNKGEEKRALAELRREICDRYVTNPESRQVEFAVPKRRTEDRSYVQGVDEWHAAIAEKYAAMIAGEIGDDGIGAFLVWGDPMLYDSTIRILERVKAMHVVEFDVEVIAGITSLQALCAAHRIPLNLVGKPVEITTGRRLAEHFPGQVETAAVMLDGEQAFSKIDDPDAMIYWGAYLGMPEEIKRAGRLSDLSDEILRLREEKRTENGWIMDIYLLRKGHDFDD